MWKRRTVSDTVGRPYTVLLFRNTPYSALFKDLRTIIDPFRVHHFEAWPPSETRRLLKLNTTSYLYTIHFTQEQSEAGWSVEQLILHVFESKLRLDWQIISKYLFSAFWRVLRKYFVESVSLQMGIHWGFLEIFKYKHLLIYIWL